MTYCFSYTTLLSPEHGGIDHSRYSGLFLYYKLLCLLQLCSDENVIYSLYGIVKIIVGNADDDVEFG